MSFEAEQPGEVSSRSHDGASERTGKRWLKRGLWGLLGLALIWLVLIPTLQMLLANSSPQPHIHELEEMTLADLILLRVVEALTGLWFFALGGAIGSFLNVVVYRLPRGKSLLLERSRCPTCDTAIAGRDNIPILGWVWLEGRCRVCRQPISTRYPLVEAGMASLFLLFYFVELISGGVNLPVRVPNAFAGVVWIIFYTKWDLVRLYLFHCFLWSTLLAWALIHFDGERVPLRSIVTAVLGAWIAAACWPDLLLLPVTGFANSVLVGGGDGGGWLAAVVGSVAGVAVGGYVWGLRRRDRDRDDGMPSEWGRQVCSETAPYVMLGGVLGWQGMLSASLLNLVVRLGLNVLAPRWSRRIPKSASLLVATTGQHLIWRWLVHAGAPWWPGLETGPGVLTVWLGLLVCLGLLTRVTEPAESPPPPTELSESPTGETGVDPAAAAN